MIYINVILLIFFSFLQENASLQQKLYGDAYNYKNVIIILCAIIIFQIAIKIAKYIDDV